MARRFKSRATAGRHFKSGTMAQFTAVSDIKSTAYRGDGDAGTLPADVDTGGNAAIYAPVCAATFSNESTWYVFFRAEHGTLAYRIGMAKVFNVYAIWDIREGIPRPSWFATYTPNIANSVANTTNAVTNTKYYSLTSVNSYLQWTVPAAANGMNRLTILSVVVSGGGTADVVINAGLPGQVTVGQVNTNGGTTTYRSESTISLTTPLATGDTIRLKWAAGNSATVRINCIIAYDSTRVADYDESFVIPSMTLTNQVGSSFECAYAVAPDGSTPKFAGGVAHQSLTSSCKEINCVTSWKKDQEDWTPVVGWTSGLFDYDRTSDVDYDGTPTVIGTLYTRYRFGTNFLDVKTRFTAAVALSLGNCYPSMWSAAALQSHHGDPSILFGDGTLETIGQHDGSNHYAVSAAEARSNLFRYSPGGMVIRVEITGLTHDLVDVWVASRAAPSTDDKLYCRITPESAAGTVWGGSWRAAFSALPVLPAPSVVVNPEMYGVASTEITGTFDEAARNTDPGESNVKDGVTYKILNVAKEGTFSGVYPATDEVDGGVMYGPTGTEYEGTGVNATTIRAALGMATANLDTQLAAIVEDTGTTLPNAIAALGSPQQAGEEVTLPDPAPAGYGGDSIALSGTTISVSDA